MIRRQTVDFIAIGKNIAKARTSMKLTQREVSDLLDVNEKYISEVESGAGLSLPLFLGLCNLLRIDANFVLKENLLCVPKQWEETDPIHQNILRCLRVCTPEEKEYFWNILRTYPRLLKWTEEKTKVQG